MIRRKDATTDRQAALDALRLEAIIALTQYKRARGKGRTFAGIGNTPSREVRRLRWRAEQSVTAYRTMAATAKREGWLA